MTDQVTDQVTSPPTSPPSVAALWYYPVKSMAGVPLDETDVGWAGVKGDRRWAFVRPDTQAHGFPWHTIRELPTMGHYVPRHLDRDRPDHSEVEVRTPAGRTYALTDPALAAELGPGVTLFRENRGIFDDAPLTLITTATVAALCELAEVPADPQRFRPNLLVQSDTAYLEDEWVGHTLQLGDTLVRVDQRDPRCVMVNVNPVSGERDAGLLKVIGRERRACAGVYATVVRPGTIRLGDPLVPTD